MRASATPFVIRQNFVAPLSYYRAKASDTGRGILIDIMS